MAIADGPDLERDQIHAGGRHCRRHDPSSLRLYDEQPNGPTRVLEAGRIGIAVVAEGEALLTTTGYAWEPWKQVEWHERRKQGFNDLGAAMRDLSSPSHDE